MAGSVFKTSKVGTSVETLATGAVTGGIAVDDSRVYFADGNAVKRVLIQGGAVTTLATSTDAVWHIALDATHVYWTSTHAGFPLLRVPK